MQHCTIHVEGEEMLYIDGYICVPWPPNWPMGSSAEGISAEGMSAAAEEIFNAAHCTKCAAPFHDRHDHSCRGLFHDEQVESH